MSTAKTIIKNSLVLLISQVVTFVIGFIYITYTARYLGVEEFGIFSYAIAFSGIFTIFIDFGINTLVVRDLSRDKAHADKYLGNVFAIKIAMATIVYLLIILAVHLLGYSGEVIATISLMAFSNVLLSLNNTFYSVFQAYERFEYQSAGAICSSVLMLAGICAAVRLDAGITGIAAIYVAVNLVVLLFNAAVCFRRFTIPKALLDRKVIMAIAFSAIPFGMTTIFATGISSMDVILLRSFSGNDAVGLYSAGQRIISYLLYLPVIINLAIYPVMARFYLSSRHSLELITKEYLKFMLIVSAPIGISIFVLSPRIIDLLYGEAFADSVVVMQLLIWSTVLIYNNAAYVRLFESVNRQAFVTLINGICLIVNLALNLILIPRYSYIGAGVTSVATQLAFVSLITYFAYRQGYGLAPGRLVSIVMKVAISATALTGALLFLNGTNVVVQVGVSAAVYFATLYMVKGLDSDDLKIFRALVKRTPTRR